MSQLNQESHGAGTMNEQQLDQISRALYSYCKVMSEHNCYCYLWGYLWELNYTRMGQLFDIIAFWLNRYIIRRIWQQPHNKFRFVERWLHSHSATLHAHVALSHYKSAHEYVCSWASSRQPIRCILAPLVETRKFRFVDVLSSSIM